MPDVVIETYEICLGMGPSDLSLIVYVPGLVSMDAAKTMLRSLVEARRSGAIDPQLFAAGAEFFIRTSPGAQTAAVTDVTRGETVLRELGDQAMSIALFARHQNPNGFVRIGSAPAAVISRFTT